MKNTKKAFSLIEILLVLSITITFLIGAFYLYQKVSTDYKIKELNRELTSISSQAINLAYTSGFDTINADPSAFVPAFPHDLIETSLVPTEDPYNPKVNSRAYKSPFGGLIRTSVVYSDINSTYYDSYYINANIGFDPAVCIAIAYEQIRNKNLINMEINYQSIFYTDPRTGVRNQSEEEIKNKIIYNCANKILPEGVVDNGNIISLYYF